MVLENERLVTFVTIICTKVCNGTYLPPSTNALLLHKLSKVTVHMLKWSGQKS